MKVLIKSLVVLALIAIGVTAFGVFSEPSQAGDKSKVDQAALKRTRKQVQMLDGIYKSGVVLITENYVNEESDLPAGTAFKKLFETAKKNGWHEVRLLDATGQPYDDVNSPKDDFEKAAVKALKGGESYYEKIVDKDGRPHLRAATIIPVVMKKCVMCHENYEDVPKGQAIGALSYTIAIE